VCARSRENRCWVTGAVNRSRVVSRQNTPGDGVTAFSFKKDDRLLKRYEFIGIFTSGKTVHSSCFLAGIKKNRMERVRLGITVSKKVGKAARRNRIKRHVREFFRLHRDNLSNGWDINVIAKKKAVDASPAELERSLAELFHRSSREFPSDR